MKAKFSGQGRTLPRHGDKSSTQAAASIVLPHSTAAGGADLDFSMATLISTILTITSIEGIGTKYAPLIFNSEVALLCLQPAACSACRILDLGRPLSRQTVRAFGVEDDNMSQGQEPLNLKSSHGIPFSPGHMTQVSLES